MSEAPLSSVKTDAPQDAMSWLREHAQAAPAGHWDELRDRLSGAQAEAAAPAGLWADFISRLGPEGLAGLNARMANLRRQVHDNGITYNVHTQADGPQRPWALDLFPLMIEAADWQQIVQGVRQRMALLEHIMQDAYGPQALVAQGLLPAALVQGHPGYLPPMHGAPAVGGRYLSLVAFDLARGPDGLWWLLSQRTQAPSGLGYLLENRLIVSRLFPEAFEALPVQRLASTYQALVEGLKARSPVAEGEAPHIALLTPGPYNETYFEHAYLARYLGLTLVQADDLTVREDKLYLKTLQGLQRVHGLLKRVDDTWLDPLELRADSALGVPGLLQAVRSGQLLVANTPGSGFLESNALLGFMPALAQHILGEELVLPAIPSWWCGEAAALPEAIAHLTDLAHGGIVKPTYPSEGARQGFEPRLGKQMTPGERDEWVERILHEPEAHTVQSWLPLAHQPIWDDRVASSEALQTRPAILRVFAVADSTGQCQVLPGGLARLGTPSGIASMRRGGSSADVWVQAPDRNAVETFSLLGQPATTMARQRLVTSRAAENLFWMGRYTERTENTLRLVRLSLEILGSENQNLPGLLNFITRMAMRHGLVRAGVPAASQAHRVFERSLIAGLWDKELATSVGFNLRSVRLAAASVRERLSPEHWRLLEQAESRFFQPAQDSTGAEPTAQATPDTVTDTLADTVAVQRLLADTSQMLAALTGAQTDRMSRDDGWRLLSIGRHIERLEFLSSALSEAVQLDLIGEQAGFDAVLDLFDSTISFQAQYQQSRTPQALMDLLVTNADNPRSLGWVAHTLRSRLRRMGHLADGATTPMADRVPQLIALTPEALWPLNHPATRQAKPDDSPLPLHAALAHCQTAARNVSDQLCALFFTHSGEARYSVGA